MQVHRLGRNDDRSQRIGEADSVGLDVFYMIGPGIHQHYPIACTSQMASDISAHCTGAQYCYAQSF